MTVRILFAVLVALAPVGVPFAAHAPAIDDAAEVRGRSFLAGDTINLGGAEGEVLGMAVRFAAGHG